MSIPRRLPEQIISKDQFYDLYITKNLNKNQICQLLKIGRSKFNEILKCYKINKTKIIHDHSDISKEKLYDLYIIKNLSCKEIEKALNLTHHQLTRLLNKFNIRKLIETKNNLTNEKLYKAYIKENKGLKKICKEFRVPRKFVLAKLKKCKLENLKKPLIINKEELYNIYIIENLSIKDTAKKLNTTIGIITRNLNIYGIKKSIEDIQKSIRKSCDRNGTHISSKPENKIAEILKTKFSLVKRQYYNKKLYPFRCDFYIPELDLYIEYQGTWNHGIDGSHLLGPYDFNNPKHQAVIEKWKSSADEIEARTGKKSRYRDAIDTWTRRDPLKRQTAVANHLNWYEFFTFNEFLDWFNSL